jgi:hypothetical protein
LNSDHLLLARRTIIIPGEFYKGGVSLSPRPIEGEDEERRKAIVRKWMVACKVSEYVPRFLVLRAECNVSFWMRHGFLEANLHFITPSEESTKDQRGLIANNTWY